MKCRIAGVIILGLCAMQAGRADLTMRHTLTIKFGSFLPPQAMDAIRQQLGNRMPEGTLVQVKGDRVCASMAKMFSVTDYAKGQITLVDPETRRFATVPLADYPAKILAAQKLPAMSPDAQRIFDNMKLDVKASKTGQTATIQGIRTEENLLVFSLEVTAGIQMRMEIHNWTAGVDELQGRPELRELAAYVGRPKGPLNPVEMVTKILAAVPGMGEKLREPMQEIMKASGGAVIRMQAATYMPAMAQAMGGGAPGATGEPAAEVTMELAELSAAPIPDSRFEVPAGYQTAAMEDLLGAFFPAAQHAAQPATQGGPKAEIPRGETGRIQTATPAPAPGVLRVGNGVSAPQILERPEPSYTDEARAAKIQGTVLLKAVVRPDGTAGQIEVLRSLDIGLDQKAVEAVSTWKFKPGMKDGKPVSVQLTIEVTFRLL
jgi:TonB family protein